LHYDIVHRCPNAQLVKVIQESQLPLISTSYTIERYQDVEVIHGTLPQHLNVITCLLEKNATRAAEALSYHLEQAARVNVPRLERLPPLGAGRYPPFLAPVT
jgi:DNA-binding GntR family transcriptional regulator